jgi:hypothetical protein
MSERNENEREYYHPERGDLPAWGLWVLAAMLVVFSCVVHAQTATCAWNADCLKWDRPTTYVDGTTLASTDVASYEIEAALLGSTAWTKVGTVSAPIQAFTRIGIKANEIWQYRVTVVLVSGQRSTPSNVQVGPTTVEPAPNPPVRHRRARCELQARIRRQRAARRAALEREVRDTDQAARRRREVRVN